MSPLESHGEVPDHIWEAARISESYGSDVSWNFDPSGMTIKVDGRQIWPQPPVEPGVAALGALVETIICDGLDDIEDDYFAEGVMSSTAIHIGSQGPEVIGTPLFAWYSAPDDKADFRNVDFSACQQQVYTFTLGERYELTGKPIWMGIDYAAGCEPKKPSNAKPALPALQTVAGDKYRGLGWCDQ